MTTAHRRFVSSFVVAGGELEASDRGRDVVHQELAHRLGQRLATDISIASCSAGYVSERDHSCFVLVNRLAYGVDRAELSRLIESSFGDLGPVQLVVAEV